MIFLKGNISTGWRKTVGSKGGHNGKLRIMKKSTNWCSLLKSLATLTAFYKAQIRCDNLFRKCGSEKITAVTVEQTSFTLLFIQGSRNTGNFIFSICFTFSPLLQAFCKLCWSLYLATLKSWFTKNYPWVLCHLDFFSPSQQSTFLKTYFQSQNS